MPPIAIGTTGLALKTLLARIVCRPSLLQRIGGAADSSPALVQHMRLYQYVAVMPGANRVKYLIEKFRFGRGRLSRSLVAVGRYTRSSGLHDGAPLTGATIRRSQIIGNRESVSTLLDGVVLTM